LSVGFSSIIAITLVPILMLMFIRGRLHPEPENPISRAMRALYLPVLRFCLRHRALTVIINLAFLAATLPLMWRLGSQFIPPSTRALRSICRLRFPAFRSLRPRY
jgi:Cu(I)/Ag(I) efflux system membrane protein CusA/SilA